MILMASKQLSTVILCFLAFSVRASKRKKKVCGIKKSEHIHSGGQFCVRSKTINLLSGNNSIFIPTSFISLFMMWNYRTFCVLNDINYTFALLTTLPTCHAWMPWAVVDGAENSLHFSCLIFKTEKLLVNAIHEMIGYFCHFWSNCELWD